MLDQIFLGNTLYTWIIFIGIITGSVTLGWIVNRILLKLGRRAKLTLLQEIIERASRFGLLIFTFLGGITWN